MFILKLVKNLFFLQDLASWLTSLVPPVIEHNIEKYSALKKAFYLTALDGVEGDYLEFGIFTGNSLITATRVHKKMRSFQNINTKFWGFDSFKGFGKISSEDRHPFFQDEIFSVSQDRILNRIRKKTRECDVEIVPGFFDETLAQSSAPQRGIQKARIIFIDCDLKRPAKLALDWVKTVLQPGSILLLDDYFAYSGSDEKGTSGAFNQFQKENPHLMFRQLFFYGYGGVAFIVSRTEETVANAKLLKLA